MAQEPYCECGLAAARAAAHGDDGAAHRPLPRSVHGQAGEVAGRGGADLEERVLLVAHESERTAALQDRHGQRGGGGYRRP